MVGEFLNIPVIPMVVKETVMDAKIRCHRSLEAGSVILEAPLPMLFTTQRGLNEPRFTSISGIRKAKQKPLEIKTPADIGIDTMDTEKSLTQITSLRFPEKRKGGRIIDGDTAQAKVAELLRLLHEEAKVI